MCIRDRYEGDHEHGLDTYGKKVQPIPISYLTAGVQEVRAWTITNGTKAPQAAGKIHTDFEKGFIRAEIVSFDDLMACGSMAAAKEKGVISFFQNSENSGYEYQVAPDMAMTVRMIMILA